MSPTASKRPPLAGDLDKEPAWQHAGLADWLTEQTGYEVDPTSVMLAVSRVNDYRKTDHYDAARNAYVEARDGDKNARREANLAKMRERAEALQAKAAELLAKAGGAPVVDAPTPPVASKATAAKAPAKSPAKAAAKKAPAKAAKPATKPKPVPAPSADDEF